MYRNRGLIRAAAIVVLASMVAPAAALGQTVAQLEQQATQEPAKKDCIQSREQGKSAAKADHGTGGWIAGGATGGVLLGLIGTGVVTALAMTSDPFPQAIPPGVDEACFANGYEKKAKSKNTRSALVSGLLGTVVFIGAAYALSD
jgi:hypothetical protein